MRISDWSSDVCSSDLSHRTYGAFIGGKTRTILLPMLLWNLLALLIISGGAYAEFLKAPIPVSFQEAFNQLLCLTAPRSAEHTSDLQSLMRISYAVFCLKKKTL